MANPMSQADTWNLVAPGYETETMPMFEVYARALLERIKYPQECERALDVACGPGTLSLLLKDRAKRVDSVDFSKEMLALLKARVARENIANIVMQQMDGQSLEFDSESFDFAFSMFGLMFFPDRGRGFSELYRVLKPGGRAGVTSWAPLNKSSLMQTVFSAFSKAFPPGEGKKKSSDIETLEDPEVFRKEMQAAGFKKVEVSECKGTWPVHNYEEFVDSLEKGAAPITLTKKNTDPEAWAEKRTIIVNELKQSLPKLPVDLSSTAYLGIGSK